MHNVWFSEELRDNLESAFSKEKLFNYFSKVYNKKETSKMFELEFYSFIGKKDSLMSYPSMGQREVLLSKYGGVEEVHREMNKYHSHMLQKYAGMSDPEDYNTMSIPLSKRALEEILPEIKESIEKGKKVSSKSIDKVLSPATFYAGVILGPKLIEPTSYS